MGYLEAKNKIRRAVTHLARRIKGEPRIIASLTSYPPRIGTVDKAIRSLLAKKPYLTRLFYTFTKVISRGAKETCRRSFESYSRMMSLSVGWTRI